MNDTDVETHEVAKEKPVRLADRHVEKLLRNTQTTYRSSQNADYREQLLESCQNALEKRHVDQTWYSEEEFNGLNVTSWINILDEAESETVKVVEKDFIRVGGAARFRRRADLSQPIHNENNFKLVQEMSTREQRELRQKVEDERQANIRAEEEAQKEAERMTNGKERIERHNREVEERSRQRELEEQAEKEILRQRVEEARSTGVGEGQRLAGKIYDSLQRAEVDEILGSIIDANKRIGLVTNEAEVKEGLLRSIDRIAIGDVPGHLTGSSIGRQYIGRYYQGVRKSSHREATVREVGTEERRVDSLGLDLARVRRLEVGHEVQPPLEVGKIDSSVFTLYRPPELEYKDARKHASVRVRAYKSGMKTGYDSIKEQNPFTDETRPWYIPRSESKEQEVN